MILVQVDQQAQRLSVQGHSPGDPRVCAAVSALMWMLHTRHHAPQPVSGTFTYEWPKRKQHVIDVVVDTVSLLAETYPTHIELWLS